MNNVIFGVNDKIATYVIFKNIKKFIDSEYSIKERVQCYNILQNVLMCFKIYSNSFMNDVNNIRMHMADYIASYEERIYDDNGNFRYPNDIFIMNGIEKEFENLKKNYIDKNTIDMLDKIKSIDKKKVYDYDEFEQIELKYDDVIAEVEYEGRKAVLHLIDGDDIKLIHKVDIFII